MKPEILEQNQKTIKRCISKVGRDVKITVKFLKEECFEEKEELTEVKTIMQHKLTLLESQLQELKVCMYMHLKRNSV